MALGAGTRLGPYEIGSLLGVGGMGEVYRARDTRLDRDVAIKVLPESFAADPERVARFDREAKTLASLNHPNIGQIYGLEDADGAKALVLELVEGPTLDERIRRPEGLRLPGDGSGRPSGLPIDEALSIARQIADALEAAHEHGIVHRDLKPANIKVRADGTVKVLDFGLAKASGPAEAGLYAQSGAGSKAQDPAYVLSQSPTITSPAATRLGVILGTAAYMSPEQAKGRAADKRTDIWAFGCVLYEMLTGKRAFEGDDVSDTMAAILRGEPDWAGLPAEVPPSIRKLLRRCVDKDRTRRLADIADARFEIDEALIAPVSDAGAPAATSWARIRPFVLATVALVAGVVAGWSLKPAPAPSLPVTRFTVALPDTQRLTPANRWGLALSPDGSALVYVANNQLYLRFMDRQEPQPVPGTENATSPFFSPDGQWVGFVGGPSTNQLKRVAVNGGAPITICDLPGNVFGAHWDADDTILYGYFGGIWRVSAAGGMPERVIALDAAKYEWAADPELLPGGDAVLFRTGTGSSSSDFAVTGQIVAQPLSSGSRRVLIDRALRATALPTGHLLYAQETSLLAVPFDAARLELTGGPVPLTDGIFPGQFTVAGDNALAFFPRSTTIAVEGMLAWVDRAGDVTPFPQLRGPITTPRVSPDGRRVAVEVATEGDAQDIWVYDVDRPTRTRLTFVGAAGTGAFDPVWTSDGRRVTYGSGETGGSQLHWVTADGSGQPERLVTSPALQSPHSWSPDGTVLAFYERSEQGALRDIWVLPMAAERKPVPLLVTPFNERSPMFSPDGRWLAYVSDESGRDEIYVRSYPASGEKIPISADGGTDPVWSRDGRELFYRSGASLMAVPVKTGTVFTLGRPEKLFDQQMAIQVNPGTGSLNYDVAPDGRFVMVIPTGGNHEFEFVLNWFEELKRRMPAN